MKPERYQIRIVGTLPEEELAELAGVRVVATFLGGTVLEGVLPDQAALVGTVVRLEGIGHPVRELFVVGSTTDDEGAT